MTKSPIYSEKRPSKTRLYHACAIAALAAGIAITGLLASPDRAQAPSDHLAKRTSEVRSDQDFRTS